MYEMNNMGFGMGGFNPNAFNPGRYPSFGAASQNLIRVTGYEGAKAYQMPPNSSVALFDADSDIFFVKSTDGAGFPTIKSFSFSPIENVPQNQNDYVTRSEFEELKGMIINGKQHIWESDDTIQ